MPSNISLLHPYYLLLLPCIGLWLHWRKNNSHTWPQLLPLLSMRYPQLRQQQSKISLTSSNTNDRLTALALALMVVALTQPIHYTQALASKQQSEPVDMILVVGTSISMTLRDYSFNGQSIDRMSLTRTLLDPFIQQYSGKRIGLVIMGNPPALWLPLTTDKAVVREAVGRIRTVLGGRLSNMGKTLQLVREQFTTAGDKVVVLISDGGLQLGAISPQQAASDLSQAGFTLYVLAMGSTDNTSNSEMAGLIQQPVDLNMLQQLAQLGKGKMFHAKNADTFSEALHAIESQHRKPIPPAVEKRLHDAWYPYPLALALFILLYITLLKSAPRHHSGGIK